MARGEQLGRQWRIIQRIITAGRGLTVSELAGDLECHQRTVYRDLEALQLAGFPLYTDMVDGKNRWSVLDTVNNELPIPVDLTELMSLYLSRGLLQPLKNTPFFTSLDRFFDKIRSILPPETLSYLEQIEQTIVVGHSPRRVAAEVTPILDQLNRAVAENRVIDMAYYTISRKSESRRQVEPVRIWFMNNAFYLVGYCRLREDIRIFAIDRIKTLELTDETFERSTDDTVVDMLRNSFGVFLGAPERIRVWFSPAVAGHIGEKIWHHSQQIVPAGDGSVVFALDVPVTDEIKWWILQWGADARVLEPETLKQDIINEINKMKEAYDTPAQLT